MCYLSVILHPKKDTLVQWNSVMVTWIQETHKTEGKMYYHGGVNEGLGDVLNYSLNN